MNKLKRPVKKYSFPNSELYDISGRVINSMKRNLEEFEKFGIHLSDIEETSALRKYCIDMDSDREFKNQIFAESEKKLEYRARIYKAVKQVITRAEIIWGVNSSKIARFGSSKMKRLTDSALLFDAMNVYRIGQSNFSELSQYGLEQTVLDEIETNIDNIESILQKIIKIKHARVEKTDDRIFAGNELYTQISQYCRIAKTIWRSRDPAKYEDYLLHAKPGNRPASDIEK